MKSISSSYSVFPQSFLHLPSSCFWSDSSRSFESCSNISHNMFLDLSPIFSSRSFLSLPASSIQIFMQLLTLIVPRAAISSFPLPLPLLPFSPLVLLSPLRHLHHNPSAKHLAPFSIRQRHSHAFEIEQSIFTQHCTPSTSPLIRSSTPASFHMFHAHSSLQQMCRAVRLIGTNSGQQNAEVGMSLVLQLRGYRSRSPDERRRKEINGDGTA